jgi:hypothetical protein
VTRTERLEALLCTPAQWSYIRRLLREGFASHYKGGPNLDEHHMPTNYMKQQASADIATLLAAKARGWKD